MAKTSVWMPFFFLSLFFSLFFCFVCLPLLCKVQTHCHSSKKTHFILTLEVSICHHKGHRLIHPGEIWSSTDFLNWPSRWPAPCNFHRVLCALQIQTITKPTAGFISRGGKASRGQNSVQDRTMQTSSIFIEHFILWGSNTKLGLFTKESLVQKIQ